MRTIPQQTIASEVSFDGIGLHTGRRTRMVLRPAVADHGIVFFRRTRKGEGAIPATWANALKLPFCTGIGQKNGVKVRTTEHLMAALYAAGIDNVAIHLDAEEVPILDGSARPFIEAFDATGTRPLDVPRRYLRILKKIEIIDPQHRILLEPAKVGFHMSVDIGVPGVGDQHWAGEISSRCLRDEILPARTFTRLKRAWPVLFTKLLGYPPIGRGIHPSRILLLSGDKVLNKEKLRFENECVRHRALDAVGDLYLAGAPLIGKYTGETPTHHLNQLVLRKLFSDPDAWKWEHIAIEEDPVR